MSTEETKLQHTSFDQKEVPNTPDMIYSSEILNWPSVTSILKNHGKHAYTGER